MKFPHYYQLDQMDCGPTCLRMLAKFYGRSYTAQTLREKAQISKDGVSILGISEAAEAIGFHSIGVKITIKKLLSQVPLPCLLHWEQSHFVILYDVRPAQTNIILGIFSWLTGRLTPSQSQRTAECKTNMFYVSDPAKGLLTYSMAEFEKHWLATSNEGMALLLEPTSRFYEEQGENSPILSHSQLAGYLWQYRRLILQLGLGMLVGSGLSLLLPFLTQSIVDVGISTRNMSFINIVLIGQIVLLCSTSAVDFIRGWIVLHISTRLNLSILSEFLAKLMRLPVSFFDVKQFGDIMQRIGDHHRIESFLTGQTLSVVFSLLNLLIFGFILAYYHSSIFVVALGAAIMYSFWVTLFLKQRRKLDARRFDVSSKNQSQIVQLIQGMQEIKLAGAETQKRWEWEHTQAKLFRWNVKNLSLSQFQQAGGLLINQGKNILISSLAAKAVLNGQLTLGGMMSVQYILGQFNAPIEQMVNFLQSLQDAKISLERLNEVHALADEETTSKELYSEWGQKQDIVVKDLLYAYPGAGNDPVLKKVNLTIPHGKTTAIVGTSGSGKTTLLKLLLRFYEPQCGSIFLVTAPRALTASEKITEGLENRIALEHVSHRAWRQQCGLVMQEGFIFSDTIARNIAINDEIIDKDRLYYAARVANIHEFIESMPSGYYTKIGAEGNGISQGQKQRILIARSVYKNPQLLFFDEATNALDADNESLILRNLNAFFKGKTVIIVAHRLSTVKHADQIIVMEKGEIVETGSHSELIRIKGKYFELVSNQLELAVG